MSLSARSAWGGLAKIASITSVAVRNEAGAGCLSTVRAAPQFESRMIFEESWGASDLGMLQQSGWSFYGEFGKSPGCTTLSPSASAAVAIL